MKIDSDLHSALEAPKAPTPAMYLSSIRPPFLTNPFAPPTHKSLLVLRPPHRLDRSSGASFELDKHSLGRLLEENLDLDLEKQSLEGEHAAHPIPSAPETEPQALTEDPINPSRILTQKELRTQRLIFLAVIASFNLVMALCAITSKSNGTFVLVFILIIKAKDCLSVVISAVGLTVNFIKRKIHPPEPISSKWILTLIPAYSETEEQIVRAIFSLRDNDVEPHRQVMCVVLDGQPRDIRKHMTRVVKFWKRPYVTLKYKRGFLHMVAGFIEDVPVIVIEKIANAGKKDSLVLCHDLFNFPRENIPLYTKLLREEIHRDVLPELTAGHNFSTFDMVFCTDADSVIHKGALARLAEVLVRDKNAIAVCGLVLVEIEAGAGWGLWNLYQQLQYTFGQYVRRQAESIVGKVTCLPGCITMIAVRPEMAGAIEKYAAPVTTVTVLEHQVQYLGTDRRLTFAMLSQSKTLHTRFVPDAVSETLVPQSLKHYLSQRRRWGSNAYFNNYFYLCGEKMILITRIAAFMEILRGSFIYYRIVNTILFIIGVVQSFHIMKLIPLLIVSQLPTMWFFFNVFVLQQQLRKRCFKLVLGFMINKGMSPFTSICVFTLVIKNLGSQVWGMTGGTQPVVAPTIDEKATSQTVSPSTTTEDTPEARRVAQSQEQRLVRQEMQRDMVAWNNTSHSPRASIWSVFNARRSSSVVSGIGGQAGM